MDNNPSYRTAVIMDVPQSNSTEVTIPRQPGALEQIVGFALIVPSIIGIGLLYFFEFIEK